MFLIRLTKAPTLSEQRNRAKVFRLYKFQHRWYDSTFLPEWLLIFIPQSPLYRPWPAPLSLSAWRKKKKKKDFVGFFFFFLTVMCLWVCISLTWRWMTSSETLSPLIVGSIAPRIISMRLSPVAAENCLAWSEGNSLPYLNKHTKRCTLIKL